MRCLGSLGTASPHDSKVLEEIYQRHPEHVLPIVSGDIPPSLSVSMDSVLASLQAFPRASSPGASQLNSQHFLMLFLVLQLLQPSSVWRT